MKHGLLISCLIFAFAGCSSSSQTARPLVPDKALQLTAKTSIKLSTIATGLAIAGAIYMVYDPLAPNWEIEESKLGDDTYRFALKMKRYHTGCAGESIQILKRRAGTLQYEQGFGAYQIVEYSEGIDSETLGARRVASGIVKLVQRQEADSFRMNDRY